MRRADYLARFHSQEIHTSYILYLLNTNCLTTFINSKKIFILYYINTIYIKLIVTFKIT